MSTTARLISVTFFAAACFAQTPSVSKPQSVGIVYFIDASQGQRPLADELMKVARTSIFGFYNGKRGMVGLFYNIEGAHSPFRIGVDNPQFIFTFGNPENALMYRAGSDKSRRRFPIGTLDLNRHVTTHDSGIAIEIVDAGPNTYKLAAKSPLPPGEYTIILKGSAKARARRLFTFGVD